MRYSMDLSSWKSAELSPADPDNKSRNLVQASWYVFSHFVEISFKSPNCVQAVVPRHWRVLKTVSV